MLIKLRWVCLANYATRREDMKNYCRFVFWKSKGQKSVGDREGWSTILKCIVREEVVRMRKGLKWLLMRS